MLIREYLEILWRWKWVVVVVTAVTIAVVAVGSSVMTPQYSASTTVRIAQSKDGSIPYGSVEYVERVMNTYVHLLKSRPFLEGVIQRLGLGVMPEDLARTIKVEALVNTELLEITAENPNPVLAMSIANTLGDLLVEEGQKVFAGPGKSAREILQEQLVAIEVALREDRLLLEAWSDTRTNQDESEMHPELRTRIATQEQAYATLLEDYDRAKVSDAMLASSIRIVEPATLPQVSSGPGPTFLVALAVFVGLAGGVGLAFLSENLDRRIHSEERLQATARLPVLGTIPKIAVPRRLRAGAVLLKSDEWSGASEAVRALRGIVLSVDVTARPRVCTLLVASSGPRVGRSTILVNLAMAIAQDGRTVIVVDSDLRHPCLHEVFGVPNDTGLSDAILCPSTVRAALQETQNPAVRVLTSGSLQGHPAELLGSPNMLEVIKSLSGEADVVLLDSSPLMVVADGLDLATRVDGVLFVAAK
ncbi:MAG: Wzz/FepE/Etk N-terminal domain-containing protein, partial [Anaerolineae bacterium]|nr:Wzz/FepE/Etk N-terminal domain-containing protein [Anaerolineae bacterium]